jgi:hypothetical protein
LTKFAAIFLVLVGAAQGAYNPFFDAPAAPKKPARTTLPLLPPPPVASYAPLRPPVVESSSAAVASPILYFGFVEAEKGKFALIKVDDHNIVLKEHNRVYLQNIPYFVREITSNAIVMEDGEKRVKSIYFSGERTGEKQ